MVAVAVGRCDRDGHRVVAEAERIVRIRVFRVIERQILLDRDDTGGRIDRDRERRLAVKGACGIVDDADDDAVDELQRDRAADAALVMLSA